jgi:hypothetical protein
LEWKGSPKGEPFFLYGVPRAVPPTPRGACARESGGVASSSQKRGNVILLGVFNAPRRRMTIRRIRSVLNRGREFSRPQMWRVFMSRIPTIRVRTMAIGLVVLAGLSGITLAAQDKYAVQVPDGLAFSEFRGYENWEIVAASQSADMIDVILANPAMIAAYKAGVPGNGQKFPDGSKIAKIHWTKKMNAEGFPVTVPDTLHDIDFIARDSGRFPDTGGWGYAQFNHDAASDGFTPDGRGAKCGYACHTAAATKDYIFTAYPKR